MAFKIAKNPTFTADVEVFTPNDRCGHDRSTFKAKFFQAKTEELADLRKLEQPDVLRRKLAGWDDLYDENNVQVEFNSDNIESLLNIPEAVAALSLSFWGSIIKAREKN